MADSIPLHGAEGHKPTWACIVCFAETLDDVPAVPEKGQSHG